MSKLKKEINKVIQKVKGNHDDVYAARFYDSTQVIAILNDLLSADDTDTTGPTMTRAMINQLVEALELNVKDSVDSISPSDVVDEDSFDITISSGRVTIDDYELDKDSIADTAIETISDVVHTWLDDNEIEVV